MFYLEVYTKRSDYPRKEIAMAERLSSHPPTERVSISGILLGTPLFMLGSALMLSIVGFPIGVVLFAAGLGMMTTPKAARRNDRRESHAVPESLHL